MSDAGSVKELNDRARGWLRHLWEKATTPDDWSSSGEPHEWWDRDSTAPMCAFPRFDLGESSYALPLMCEVTPAWREVYSLIARELCERHMEFWAAIDWLVLIGQDPNLDRYPPEWQIFVPERLRGAYPPPGWVGNGHPLWGLNPDPLAADGNLFYRGFFNLLLSVYQYVSGDTRYHQPFQMAGYMDRKFTWTHPELAEFISAQLAARPEGPHCENTKIWPFCVSAAGLGLQLYDAVNGTSLQNPYNAWTEFAQQHFMGLDRRGDLEWFALYYDPIEKEAGTFPDHLTSYASLCVTPYIYPQQPDWAIRLYEMSVRKLGWSNPQALINQFLPDPRFLSIALFMAHELGDTTTETRLREHVEAHFGPKFFGDDASRFGWFFDWNEPWPRGQQSALLMVPEVGGRGSWARSFHNANLAKFSQPTVEGIEFPSMGVSVARNDVERGELHIHTYAATPSHAGRTTHFRVIQLPDSSSVRVVCDGSESSAWRVIDETSIEIDVTIGDHRLTVFVGPPREGSAPDMSTGSQLKAPTASLTAAGADIRPPSLATLQSASTCSCC